MAQRVEVRCCCQPRKILGWVIVSDDIYRCAQWLVVDASVPTRFPGFSGCRSDMPGQTFAFKQVELPFAMFNPGYGERPYKALKAEGYDQVQLSELLGARFEPAA